MTPDIWYLNGYPIDNFPGMARVESVGHMMALNLELGIASYCWDFGDSQEFADALRMELEDAR